MHFVLRGYCRNYELCKSYLIVFYNYKESFEFYYLFETPQLKISSDCLAFLRGRVSNWVTRSSCMTGQVADPHAHVHRLVSVIKMATVL
jgi:hypothetical protein